MFKAVLGAVLQFLGIETLSKNKEGKSFLLSAEKEKLAQKYGDKFVQQFEEDLKAYEQDGEHVEDALSDDIKASLANTAAMEKELEEMRKAFSGMKTQLEAMKKEKVEKEEEEEVTAETRQEYVLNMSYQHNQYAEAVMKGAAYSGNDTVDTTELAKDFGKYVSGQKLNIFPKLLGELESTKYMSTIVTDKTEVRAGEANITSVLQQFTPKWTPKGKSKFTPLTIKNYKLKINVPITPADVMDEYIGYLYDENLEPKDMPIVKYILFNLIKPKLDEEREIVLATGEYKEHTASADGEEGSDAKHALDGYLTQLRKFKKETKEGVTFLQDSVAKLTKENILATVDAAVEEVSPLYRKKKMYIHADPDLVTMYGKAYREKYPYTKNEDGEKVKVDFSNFVFVPLEGMRGSGAFFLTPKENFKHLLSRDPRNMKIFFQVQNYDVKIFAEWWEGVGFWLAEALFVYLPDNSEDALGV